MPRPGELSLAHNGVLFLDELPEFKRSALEVLRQPLEEGHITISRARASVTYPSQVMLVASMNPCPCGYLGDPRRECGCTPTAVHRYRSRLSGPLLDRIDLQITVPAVPWQALSADRRGEPSAVVADRVHQARHFQEQRFGSDGPLCNGEMGGDAIRKWAQPDADGKRLLEHETRSLGLSARAYHRILRVARTIADLAGEDRVTAPHVAEAIAYRTLDRQAAPTRGSIGEWGE